MPDARHTAAWYQQIAAAFHIRANMEICPRDHRIWSQERSARYSLMARILMNIEA